MSDATRAVATAAVLPFVVDELLRGGLTLSAIRLVVATGVHRGATPAEMAAILGSYHGKLQIENHDPHDPERLFAIGKTTRSNAVEINKTVAASDLRIIIGKIEPHEFAGFSGGRKSVLPGIASARCILFNHRPEMVLHPNAVAGILAGNPIHEDMAEAARLLGVDFGVNLIQDAAGAPIGIFAGDLTASHAAGVAFYRQHFGVQLRQRADIYLVTPGFPLNIDLYQSIKALVALTPIVKAGDRIVFYAACPEGVNADDMLAPFERADGLDDVLAHLREHYQIQMDHALLLAKLYQKGVEIFAHCPGVDEEILRKMRMHPFRRLEDALCAAAAPLDVAAPLPDASEAPSTGTDMPCSAAGAPGGAAKPKLMILPAPQRFVIDA